MFDLGSLLPPPCGLVRGVFELHVHLFGLCLNSTYTYSETCLNFTSLFRCSFEPHEHSFGTSLNTTCTYSEWSRLAKLAQGVALLQVGGDEVGRIASGITWRRRRGAVLGSPHARAPKVSPKMVGPLSRGNDFGGNPQEGGNNISLSGGRNPQIKLD